MVGFKKSRLVPKKLLPHFPLSEEEPQPVLSGDAWGDETWELQSSHKNSRCIKPWQARGSSCTCRTAELWGRCSGVEQAWA